MKPNESRTVRDEMVSMHNEYIDRLEKAMESKSYVEASWLCYSLFEQRIKRLILKHISVCPKAKKKKGKDATISTRIACLQELVASQYGGYKDFAPDLLPSISKWCDRRNDLVHGLVSLEHYKEYDKEFKALAEDGEPLVKSLYAESTRFRKWWYSNRELPAFPKFSCKCQKYRCLVEE